MLKKSFFSSLLALTLPAGAALSVTDLAIIGLRDSTPDEVSLVALNTIMVGEKIFFGDVGINTTTVAKQGDLYELTVTAEIGIGSVITLEDSATGVGSTWIPSIAGTGSVSLAPRSSADSPYGDTSANANISGGDPFLIFGSTDNATTTANTTPLFSLNSTTAYSPEGLSTGNGILSRTSGQDLRYTGTREGTAASLFSSISDINNWELFSTTGAGETNDTTNGATFDVAAVPEPGTSLLAGLGVGLLVCRRRSH